MLPELHASSWWERGLPTAGKEKQDAWLIYPAPWPPIKATLASYPLEETTNQAFKVQPQLGIHAQPTVLRLQSALHLLVLELSTEQPDPCAPGHIIFIQSLALVCPAQQLLAAWQKNTVRHGRGWVWGLFAV